MKISILVTKIYYTANTLNVSVNLHQFSKLTKRIWKRSCVQKTTFIFVVTNFWNKLSDAKNVKRHLRSCYIFYKKIHNLLNNFYFIFLSESAGTVHILHLAIIFRDYVQQTVGLSQRCQKSLHKFSSAQYKLNIVFFSSVTFLKNDDSV